MDKRTVAVFDVDGTLTRSDTFLEFLKFFKGKDQFFACLVVNAPFIVLFYLKLIPNYRLKERFFRFFLKGERVDHVGEIGDKFAKNQFPTLFYPSARAVLDWHKKQDHLIIFLTASSSIWLKSWCENEGIYFEGTEFATENGQYTGSIQGKNCYGEEKVVRLSSLMERLNISEIDYGYGDSFADRHFLTMAKKSYQFSLTEPNVRKHLPFVNYTNHTKLE